VVNSLATSDCDPEKAHLFPNSQPLSGFNYRMWDTSAALIAGVTVTQKVLRYSRIFQDCKPIRFNYRLPGCVCLGLSGISSRSINTSFGVTGTLISSLPMTVTPIILQPLCLVRWPLACLFSPVQPVRAAIRNYFATTRGPKAAKS